MNDVVSKKMIIVGVIIGLIIKLVIFGIAIIAVLKIAKWIGVI